MAKKETVKKTATKKATTKKVAVKKEEKITTPESIVDNIDTKGALKTETEQGSPYDPSIWEAKVDFVEEVEKPELNYEEIYKEQMPEEDTLFQEQVIRHVASEILVENNNSIDDLINMATEDVVEKAKEKIEEIKKINNERVNARIDNIFGYLWNGQEMDY